MTNHFACGAMKKPEGWIAYYRMVHHNENFVLREGKRDRLFTSKQEAKEAAWDAFMAYLNSPIIGGLVAPQESQWDSANAAFNLPATQRPTRVRARGKTRLTQVVRKGGAV